MSKYELGLIVERGTRDARAAGAALMSRRSRRPALGLMLLAMAYLAGIRLAFADPASDGSHTCAVASSEEAVALADVLYEKGEYQHAGACYQAAGNLDRANVAFAKAAGPKAEATARVFTTQRDAAKLLFEGVQQAFRHSR